MTAVSATVDDAAVCDWTFYVHLSRLPKWTGKTEQHFTNWVRHNCADAFVFVDISNEFKHANRKSPSSLAQKMMLSFIDLGVHPDLRASVDLTIGWIQSMGSGDWYFFPSIRFNGETEYFYDPAERAIAWWKLFTPTQAEPMDATGNILSRH